MPGCYRGPSVSIMRCLQAALQAAGALQRLVALLRAADAISDSKEAISAAAALRNFANTPAHRAAIRCGHGGMAIRTLNFQAIIALLVAMNSGCGPCSTMMYGAAALGR